MSARWIACLFLFAGCARFQDQPADGYLEQLERWESAERAHTTTPTHEDELRHRARSFAPEVRRLERSLELAQTSLTLLKQPRRPGELRVAYTEGYNRDDPEVRVGYRLYGRDNPTEFATEQYILRAEIEALQALLQSARWNAEWKAVHAFRRLQAAGKSAALFETQIEAQQLLVDRSLSQAKVGTVALGDSMMEQRRLLRLLGDQEEVRQSGDEASAELLRLTGADGFREATDTGVLAVPDSGFLDRESATARVRFHPDLQAVHHQLRSEYWQRYARLLDGHRPRLRFLEAEVADNQGEGDPRWTFTAAMPLQVARLIFGTAGRRLLDTAWVEYSEAEFDRAVREKLFQVEQALARQHTAAAAWERVAPTIETIRTQTALRIGELEAVPAAQERLARLRRIRAEAGVQELNQLLALHEAEIALMLAIGPPRQEQ